MKTAVSWQHSAYTSVQVSMKEGKRTRIKGEGRLMLHKKDCIDAAIVLGMVGDLGILPYKGGEEKRTWLH